MPVLEDVSNWLKGLTGGQPSYSTPSSKVIPATENPSYPTSDDVKSARQNDYSYGQPWAREFTGNSMRFLAEDPNSAFRAQRPLKARTFTNEGGFRSDTLAKAALASNRSALASLGFDPTKMSLDFTQDPSKVNMTGLTRSGVGKSDIPVDDIYVNARDESVPVHESIHRGIERLHDSKFWKPEFDEMYKPDMNEYLVRHLMQSKMGNPEETSYSGDRDKKQRQHASWLFNSDLTGASRRQDLINQMEAAAAQAVMSHRPGGPR